MSELLLPKTKVTKYVSEIFDLPKVKDFFTLHKHNFLILLGGKGVGKSTYAFNELIKHINNGETVAYMRNTLEEIKQIKAYIGNKIQNETQFKNVSISDNNITNKEDKRIICNFVTPKNYNKIAGNTTPHGFLFYDEFNQILSTDITTLTENFWTILNTLFRNNRFNVIACGNTNTTNNILFNLFKIDLPPINNNIEVFNEYDYVTIVRYLDTAFKELNMDEKDLEMIKLFNPKLYREQIAGKLYHQANDLVLNRINYEEWDMTNNKIIFHEYLYDVYTHKKNKNIYLLDTSQDSLSLTYCNENKHINFYDMDEEYMHSSKAIKDFYISKFAVNIKKALQNQLCFFGTYAIYVGIIIDIDKIDDNSFELAAK